MQNQNGQYKPLNKNVDLNDLVCPKCGNDVPDEQYNEVTQLIKCGECDNLFAYLDKSKEELEKPTEFNEKIVPIQHQDNNTKIPYLLVSILLVVVLIIVWYLKNRTSSI